MTFLPCYKSTRDMKRPCIISILALIVVITLSIINFNTFTLSRQVIFSGIDEEISGPKEYFAAVVEYHTVGEDDRISLRDLMLKNVDEYELLIKNASRLNVDIIVFPEAGLTGIYFNRSRLYLSANLVDVPSPHQHVTPWKLPRGASHEVLRRISHAAHLNKIYVVINLLEKFNCSLQSDCPVDEFLFYNTNVVFDRQGLIIARYEINFMFTSLSLFSSNLFLPLNRYRKSHLFREPEFSAPRPTEISTFKTDFGVTFGMLICFDILFEDPAIRLLQETHVKDIIFTSAWYSKLPFLYGKHKFYPSL
nr:PREDICTED: biotinidase-like [Bemisia tabaci]